MRREPRSGSTSPARRRCTAPRPGRKLLALVLAGAGSVLRRRAVAGRGRAAWSWSVWYAVGRLSRCGPSLAQLRPLLWVAGAAAVFHVLVNGWERAVVVVGVLAALVLLAALVTLTTRTTDLVDALVAVLPAAARAAASTPSGSA